VCLAQRNIHIVTCHRLFHIMCHVAESAADPANYILSFIPDISGLTPRWKKDQRADRKKR
jgi:hypothetical protein